MADVIRLTDEFYIAAPSSATQQSRVLKHADTFGVFDLFGDIRQTGLGEQGIFHQGTRYLSNLILRFNETQPFLLSSTIKRDNLLFTIDLTNPDVLHQGRVVLRRGDLHIFRAKFLWQAACYEWLRIVNFGLATIEFGFSLQFDADFADIFEVRGLKRERRGIRLADEISADRLVLSYRGLDDQVRRSEIRFDPTPQRLTGTEAHFQTTLARNDTARFELIYSFASADAPAPLPPSLSAARQQAKRERASLCDGQCTVQTANEEFNWTLQRSAADLHMMLTETEQGLYPYAGVPWFNAPFGRDGITTALEYLWLDPRPALGVLRYLAAHQAQEINPERDAEPGKILHEKRLGEMAALNEIPFDRYYGSTDATPLFVMLAGAYYERTADLATIRAIWPQLKLALEWIDNYGDMDGDGLVESMRHASHGLVQQGWKDSWDSVSHRDGSLPEFPLALCEVQAYVYAAKRAAARLAGLLGEPDLADKLLAQSAALKEQFNQQFWCDEIDSYAIALDRAKKPCAIKASNAGHCLYAGIANPDYAQRVAQTLLSASSFSGWGIRTLDAGEMRYNPMSYHNGSVWPHDNAIIAAGLGRYGMVEAVNHVVEAIFQSALFFDLNRLPELFCGFARREGEGPTLYPVACAPQAWAAGSVFMLLQACLGLAIDAEQASVFCTAAALPKSVQRVQISNLRVGAGAIDLIIDGSRGIAVENRVGAVNVVIR